MKIKKALPLIALGIMSLSSLAGCKKSSNVVTIWTFSNELKQIAEKYYKKDTGGSVKVLIKSSVTQIKTDLRNAIKKGKNIPDIVALEAAVIADYTAVSADESYLMDLSDISGTEQMYDYTKSVATSTDGKLLA